MVLPLPALIQQVILYLRTLLQTIIHYKVHHLQLMLETQLMLQQLIFLELQDLKAQLMTSDATNLQLVLKSQMQVQ